ncbi:MAG: glycosyltransferase family 39 protein [Planctomycetota bacterium]
MAASLPASANLRSGRGVWIAVALVLLLGLVVRLVHYRAVASTAFLDIPLAASESDMYTYWQWAGQIVDGDWLGRDTFHQFTQWMREYGDLQTWYRRWGGKEIFDWEPVCPYFLAFLRMMEAGAATAALIQLLLGTLQPLIVFLLARRVLSHTTAILAAALAAIYGPLVFGQGVLLRDWMPPLLEPLALILLLDGHDSKRNWPFQAGGFVLGLCVLVKSTALLLVPLVVLWILLAPLPDVRRNPAVVGILEYTVSARIYAERGQIDRAEQEWQRLARHAKDRPEFAPLDQASTQTEAVSRIRYAQLLRSRGQNHQARQQISEAYQAAVKIAPPSVVDFDFGLLCRQLGDSTAARQYLLQYLNNNPSALAGPMPTRRASC